MSKKSIKVKLTTAYDKDKVQQEIADLIEQSYIDWCGSDSFKRNPILCTNEIGIAIRWGADEEVLEETVYFEKLLNLQLDVLGSPTKGMTKEDRLDILCLLHTEISHAFDSVKSMISEVGREE